MTAMAGSPHSRPAPERATAPLAEAIRPVLEKRGMSMRALAREVPVSSGHLSRALRSADGKRPTPALLRRITEVLQLPGDYFIETRRAHVTERLATDDELTARVFEEIDRAERR